MVRTGTGNRSPESAIAEREEKTSTTLARSRSLRYFYILLGAVSLVLGIIGIVTPILPTTPFILLSGFCFARGSDRLHDWMLGHRYFGPMIRAFHDERRIPFKVKIFATLMIALTMSVTAVFFVPLLVVKIGMALVGAGVVWYIWTFKN